MRTKKIRLIGIIGAFGLGWSILLLGAPPSSRGFVLEQDPTRPRDTDPLLLPGMLEDSARF